VKDGLLLIPRECSVSNRTTNARYQVNHANGTIMTIPIDQNPAQSWVELGTFNFNAGAAGSVRLPDITSEPYSAHRVILVNAMQWGAIAPPAMPTVRHQDE
jgi:hypothetical protein